MGLKTASLVPAAQPCRFKRSGAAGSGRGGTRLAGAAGRAAGPGAAGRSAARPRPLRALPLSTGRAVWLRKRGAGGGTWLLGNGDSGTVAGAVGWWLG